jgi:chemotaxis protein methyltransferase CheR
MDIEDLKKRVLIYTGMDLNYYNPNMLRRRVRSLLAKLGITTIDEYWELIRKDYDELRRFLDYITINVTNFNRDPIKFKYLLETIFPTILKKNPHPKIWSSACSSGEEAYSLAIILEQLRVDKSVKILATDIDSAAIDSAKKGIYKNESIANISDNILNKYFHKERDSYKIKDVLKKRILINNFNLISDNYKRSYFDLVVCRNVIIHFAREVKDTLYRNFNATLKNEGFLFLGGAEKILLPERYGCVHWKHGVYQKVKDLMAQ